MIADEVRALEEETNNDKQKNRQDSAGGRKHILGTFGKDYLFVSAAGAIREVICTVHAKKAAPKYQRPPFIIFLRSLSASAS